jgi:hypothetical protein
MHTPAAGSVTRLEVARSKALELLASLPAGSKAGVVALGETPGPECAPAGRRAPLLAAGDPALEAALDSLVPGAEGSLADALNALGNDLVAQGRARDTRVVVFTDLEASCGGDLCAAAARLVATGAWIDVVILGGATAPACLAELRPSAAQPGSLVRALTRPTPVWQLVAPGTEPAPGGISDIAGPHALEAPAGEWSIALALDRPAVLGPLRVAPGRLTRVRVLAFPGAPPRFAWEVVDERG